MSDLVESYVQRISDTWRESVEKILETASILVESEENLNDIEFLDMIGQLPISQSTISKLLMIGKTTFLQSRTEFLPAHWTTIYELSQMDEDEFDEGVENGYINPSSTMKDISKFRQIQIEGNTQGSDDEGTAAPETPSPRLGTISIPHDFDLEKMDELDKELKRIQKKFGIQFETDKTKNGMLGIRRKRLSNQMTEWLEERSKSYNKNMNFEDIEILEDAFNQHRDRVQYHQNSDGTYISNDIRNPEHPYHKMSMGDMFGWCRENLIVCAWTQLKDIDKEAHIKNLVRIHSEGNSAKRSDCKKKLQRLLKRGNDESKKWSEWALNTIVEGDD